RILFVASLHHPEALAAAITHTPADEAPPLFPPSMAQHFWERALRARGHTLDVFYRNLPVVSLARARKRKTQRHSQRITPGKLVSAAANRLPPTLNPELRIRNQRLIEKAARFRPDVLWMVGDNTVIYPETVAAIKRAHDCRVIYASGTSPIVFSHPLDRRAAPLYDLVLVNDFYHGVQWLELGAQAMECLPVSACDPDFHRPADLSDEERARYGCDIAFVGTLVPDHLYSRRVAVLEALQDFDLGIWSVHDVPPSLRKFVRGRALGEEMIRILSAAKIAVNIHGNFMLYGGNMRLFEAAGAGVCQITDDLPGTQRWFPPDHGVETILTFTDYTDLRSKVSYYLMHKAARAAIAERARAHVYAHHTYAHRVARLEELLT
ncbi:MAG: glycosyltransferase, partial [Chloroflexi bacterium]|nr:glycosyltransferase [Chloroflexota bacterium]